MGFAVLRLGWLFSVGWLLEKQIFCQTRLDTPDLAVLPFLSFVQVLDLDEKNQVLKSLIWYRLSWKDQHFKWKPSDYGDIDQSKIICFSYRLV